MASRECLPAEIALIRQGNVSEFLRVIRTRTVFFPYENPQVYTALWGLPLAPFYREIRVLFVASNWARKGRYAARLATALLPPALLHQWHSPALILACAYAVHHHGLAEWLLDRGASPRYCDPQGRTALREAALCGCLHTVQLLVHAGALAHSPGQHRDVIALSLTGPQSANTAVMVSLLIQGGADVEAPTPVPPIWLATRRNTAVVPLLLAAKVDPDAVYTLPPGYASPLGLLSDDRDYEDDTLHAERIVLMQSLLNHGANVDAKHVPSDPDSPTVLAMACLSRRTDVAKVAIEASSKLDARDNSQLRALDYAVDAGHWRTARLLVIHGASYADLPPDVQRRLQNLVESESESESEAGSDDGSGDGSDDGL